MVIKNPETIYISFGDYMPKYFELFDSIEDKPYYFRYLDGKTPRIKFNITHECDLISNVPFKIEKRCSVQTPYKLPELPAPDRNRVKPVEIILDENFDELACIYTDSGDIIISSWFASLPKQVQGFLLFHEYAHLFYSQEKDCDTYALVCSLRKGYNRSMCFYAMSHYLSKSTQNIERMAHIFEKIQETQKNILWP